MEEAKPVQRIIEVVLGERMRVLIDEAFVRQYSVFKQERYILEQCGKLYRVKDTTAVTSETRYKTGWLKLGQAQGILKLLKGNDEYDL